jgi:hypothetical protein
MEAAGKAHQQAETPAHSQRESREIRLLRTRSFRNIFRGNCQRNCSLYRATTCSKTRSRSLDKDYCFPVLRDSSACTDCDLDSRSVYRR